MEHRHGEGSPLRRTGELPAQHAQTLLPLESMLCFALTSAARRLTLDEALTLRGLSTRLVGTSS